MGSKTIKTKPDSATGIRVGDDHIVASVASGGAPRGLVINESGTYINGPISMITMPEDIRVGGFWTQNTAFLQMLPSSMAFPVPHLLVNPPLEGVQEMVDAVQWAMSLLQS